MDKLPPVSYIRLVDIWLISVQLIPFILVILRTLLEVFSDQESINHHGKARKVNSLLDSSPSFHSRMAGYLQLLGNSLLISFVHKHEYCAKAFVILEKKIFPSIYLLFALSYWIYGIFVYMD